MDTAERLEKKITNIEAFILLTILFIGIGLILLIGQSVKFWDQSVKFFNSLKGGD